jgi:hypothetical protein
VTDRELDALVAARVFGAVPCDDPVGRCDGAKTTPVQCWKMPGESHGSDLRAYSTDLAAAFLVVESMRNRTVKAWFVRLEDIAFDDPICPVGRWSCEFRHGDDSGRAVDLSLPRAICLAALAALGVKVPQ